MARLALARLTIYHTCEYSACLVWFSTACALAQPSSHTFQWRMTPVRTLCVVMCGVRCVVCGDVWCVTHLGIRTYTLTTPTRIPIPTPTPTPPPSPSPPPTPTPTLAWPLILLNPNMELLLARMKVVGQSGGWLVTYSLGWLRSVT